MVVSQEIEGEAILIHFDSGCYYSANATGSRVLDLARRGLGSGAIAQRLAEQFPEAAAESQTLVEAFLREAQVEGLLVAVADCDENADWTPDEDRPLLGGTFVAPRLERFDDLQDLLMLDPIHDVDEVGWPVPPPAGQPAEVSQG